MDNNIALFTSGVVALSQKGRKDIKWLVVKKDEESDWELPRTLARKGESSVRAGIRMLAEQAGLNVKVIEEVGRSGGATKLNGEAVSQRTIYYLMTTKDEGENLTFFEMEWLEYSKIIRRLSSKQEQQMLREARDFLKKIRKYNSKQRKAQ